MHTFSSIFISLLKHTTSILFNSLIFNDKQVKEQIEKKNKEQEQQQQQQHERLNLFNRKLLLIYVHELFLIVFDC